MKKILLIAGAATALILTGCNKGGTTDQYDASRDTLTSSNSSPNVQPANSTNGAGATGLSKQGENTGTATR